MRFGNQLEPLPETVLLAESASKGYVPFDDAQKSVWSTWSMMKRWRESDERERGLIKNMIWFNRYITPECTDQLT